MISQRMKLKKKITYSIEDQIVFIIAIICIVTYILINEFTVKSKNTLEDMANNKTNELSTIIINESIKEIIINNSLQSIINITRNDNNEITNMDLNTTQANKILYDVSYSIMKNIDNIENNNIKNLKIEYFDKKDNIFKVPFGIIHNIPILTLLGPNIPFKISILGNTSNELITEVKEYGINNSIIELRIKCIINLQIILPFKSKVIKNEKSILLSSQVIQGKVPDYYGGIMSTSLKK